VVPTQLGGQAVPANLITLCQSCHHKRHRELRRAIPELQYRTKFRNRSRDLAITIWPTIEERALIARLRELTGLASTDILHMVLQMITQGEGHLQLPWGEDIRNL
jgi:hypothetical protein